MNKRSVYLFLFFLLLVSTSFAKVEEYVILESGDKYVRLGKLIEVLEDTSKKFTLKDILLPPNKILFVKSNQPNPSYGITNSAYWAHFRVKNNLPHREEWLLQGPSIMDQMDVYFTDGDRSFIGKKGGWLTPIEQRDFSNRKILFNVPLGDLPAEFDVYVRFESQRQMAFPMTLWNYRAFAESDRTEMYVLGIYFGILLVMILYNLFVYFSLRDISYLYYVFYITCFGLAQFFENGFATEFLGTWLAPYSKHVHLFINTLTLIVSINFSRNFLNSKKQTPILDMILVGCMLFAAILLGFISLDKISWALTLGNPLIVFSIITILSVCFVCLKNGYRPVRYFLIGWFALMIGIVLYIFKTIGIVPYNFFTVYAMQIASAFEVVLFSLALADRINEIKREKELLKDNLTKELEFKVVERTREISIQKEIIEQKNKDITDSINYAERIQKAILPVKEDIRKSLPDSFILYKPRNIVSGDFYWFSELSKEKDEPSKVMIAAADCTGHGVPGAFMSMIGTSQLHKIINERGVTLPGQILTELDEGVRQALKQNKEDSTTRDGMDIALCSIEFLKEKNEKGHVADLHYAGAMRPLWLSRNGKISEIKADKFPIGGLHGESAKSFTNHNLELYKGDTIYIFTDGYIDQFGGQNGKKFMKKRFKESLESISSMSMEKQNSELEKIITGWMAEVEQVDDILIVGVRF